MEEVPNSYVDPITGLTESNPTEKTFKVGEFRPNLRTADDVGISSQLMGGVAPNDIETYQNIGLGVYNEIERYNQQGSAYGRAIANIPGYFIRGLGEFGVGVGYTPFAVADFFGLTDDERAAEDQLYMAYTFGIAHEYTNLAIPNKNLVTDPNSNALTKYITSPTGIAEGIASIASFGIGSGAVKIGTKVLTGGISKGIGKIGLNTLNSSNTWLSKGTAFMLGQEGGAMSLTGGALGQIAAKTTNKLGRAVASGMDELLTVDGLPTLTAVFVNNRIESWQQSADIINIGMSNLDKGDPNYDKKVRGILEGADKNDRWSYLSMLGDGMALKAFTKNTTGAVGSLISREITPVKLKDVGKTFLQEGAQEFWEEWVQGASQALGTKFAMNVVNNKEKDPVNFTDELFSVDAVAQGLLGAVLGAGMGAGGQGFTYVWDQIPHKIRYSVKNEKGEWVDKVAKNRAEYKKVKGEMQMKVSSDLNKELNDYFYSEYDKELKDTDVRSAIGVEGFIGNLFSLSQNEHLDGYSFEQFEKDRINKNNLTDQEKVRYDWFEGILKSRDDLATKAAESVTISNSEFEARLKQRYVDNLTGIEKVRENQQKLTPYTPIDIDKTATEQVRDSIIAWKSGKRQDAIMKELLDSSITEKTKFDEVLRTFKDLRSQVFVDSEGNSYTLDKFLNEGSIYHSDLLKLFASSYFKNLPEQDHNLELGIKLFYDIVAFKSSMEGIMNASNAVQTAAMKSVIKQEGKEHMGDFIDKALLADKFFKHANNGTVHKLRAQLQGLDQDISENRTEKVAKMSKDQKDAVTARKKELLKELDKLTNLYYRMIRNKGVNRQSNFYRYMWFKSMYNISTLDELNQSKKNVPTKEARTDYSNYIDEYNEYIEFLESKNTLEKLDKEKEEKEKAKILNDKYNKHRLNIALKYTKWTANEQAHQQYILQTSEFKYVVDQLRSMQIYESLDGHSFKMHKSAKDSYSFYEIHEITDDFAKEHAVFGMKIPVNESMIDTSTRWTKDELANLKVYDIGPNGKLIIDTKDNTKSIFIGFTKYSKFKETRIFNKDVIIPTNVEIRNALDSQGTFYTFTPEDINKSIMPGDIGIGEDIIGVKEEVKYSADSEFRDARIVEFKGGKLIIVQNTYEPSKPSTSALSAVSSITMDKKDSNEFEIELDLATTAGPIFEADEFKLLGGNKNKVKLHIVQGSKILKWAIELENLKKTLKFLETANVYKDLYSILSDPSVDPIIKHVLSNSYPYGPKEAIVYIKSLSNSINDIQAKIDSYYNIPGTDLFVTISPFEVLRLSTKDVFNKKGEVILTKGSPYESITTRREINKLLNSYIHKKEIDVTTGEVKVIKSKTTYGENIAEHVAKERIVVKDDGSINIKRITQEGDSVESSLIISDSKFVLGPSVYIPRSRTKNGTNIITGKSSSITKSVSTSASAPVSGATSTISTPATPATTIGATPASGAKTWSVYDVVSDKLTEDPYIENFMTSNAIDDARIPEVLYILSDVLDKTKDLETSDENTVKSDFTPKGLVVTYNNKDGKIETRSFPYDLSPFKTTSIVPDPIIPITPTTEPTPEPEPLPDSAPDPADLVPEDTSIPEDFKNKNAIFTSDSPTFPDGVKRTGGTMIVRLIPKIKLSNDKQTAQNIINKGGENLDINTDLDNNYNLEYTDILGGNHILRGAEGISTDALRRIKYGLIASGQETEQISVADVWLNKVKPVKADGTDTGRTADDDKVHTPVNAILDGNSENNIGVVEYSNGMFVVNGKEIAYTPTKDGKLSGRLVIYKEQNGEAIISSCASSLPANHVEVVKDSIIAGYELLTAASFSAAIDQNKIKNRDPLDLMDNLHYISFAPKKDAAIKILKRHSKIVKAILGTDIDDSITAEDILLIFKKLMFANTNNHATFVSSNTVLVGNFIFDSVSTNNAGTSPIFIISNRNALEEQFKKASANYIAALSKPGVPKNISTAKYNKDIIDILSNPSNKQYVHKVGEVKRRNKSAGTSTNVEIVIYKNISDIVNNLFDDTTQKSFYPLTNVETMQKPLDTTKVVSKDASGNYITSSKNRKEYLEYINATNSMLREGDTLSYGGNSIRLFTDFMQNKLDENDLISVIINEFTSDNVFVVLNEYLNTNEELSNLFSEAYTEENAIKFLQKFKETYPESYDGIMEEVLKCKL